MEINELGRLLNQACALMEKWERSWPMRDDKVVLGEIVAQRLALPASPVLDLTMGMEAGRASALAVRYESSFAFLQPVDQAAALGFVQGVSFAAALSNVRQEGGHVG